MRAIHKNSIPIPAILLNADTQAALQTLINTEKKAREKAVKSEIYKGTILEYNTVVIALKELYHNKCAYCENVEYQPQIEHYRPKLGVSYAKGHEGYYWLCYEWTNFVPACWDCNKASGGKGNHFPLMKSSIRQFAPPKNLADYAANSALLLAEKPLLLHPEIDAVENYFAFDAEGNMTGVDREKRGEATIKICNLKRQNLVVLRKKMIIDDFINALKSALYLYFIEKLDKNGIKIALKIAFNSFHEKQNPHQVFSLYAKYTYENFDTILLPLFSNTHQIILKDAFLQYQNGDL